MAVGTALAIGSGVVSMIGGAVAGNQASKAKGRAERAATHEEEPVEGRGCREEEAMRIKREEKEASR